MGTPAGSASVDVGRIASASSEAIAAGPPPGPMAGELPPESGLDGDGPRADAGRERTPPASGISDAAPPTLLDRDAGYGGDATGPLWKPLGGGPGVNRQCDSPEVSRWPWHSYQPQPLRGAPYALPGDGAADSPKAATKLASNSCDGGRDAGTPTGSLGAGRAISDAGRGATAGGVGRGAGSGADDATAGGASATETPPAAALGPNAASKSG